MNRTVYKQLLHLSLLCFNIMTSCSSSDATEKKEKKENPIAYFASKKDASLIESGEVSVDSNNELFFFGYSTGSETLTRYLRPKIPLTLIHLHKEKCGDYSTGLATSMKHIMVDFYTENPTIDSCDLTTQDVLLTLIHLAQKKRTISSIQCVNGKFEPVSQTVKKPINPLRTCRFFIPVITSGASELHIQSPTYKLLRSNPITRESMCKHPQEIVNKIIKDDTNKHLINLIYMSESQWLEKCDHPSISKEYQSLKKKWLQLRQGYDLHTVMSDATEIESSILSRWNHDKGELLKFAAVLRQNPKACPATALFVDNLIELASLTPKPAPKIESSCFASITALLQDDSAH